MSFIGNFILVKFVFPMFKLILITKKNSTNKIS